MLYGSKDCFVLKYILIYSFKTANEEYSFKIILKVSSLILKLRKVRIISTVYRESEENPTMKIHMPDYDKFCRNLLYPHLR